MSEAKAKKQTMFDKFEIKGVWWLSETPDDKEAGILFFSETEIILELIGSVNNEPYTDGRNKYDVLHGLSDKGEKITLIDVFTKNISTNIPGFQTETLSIQSFIVGDFLNSIDQSKFHSLAFQPTYLTEWLGRQMFSNESVYEKETSKLLSEKVSFNQVDTFAYQIESIDARIEEAYMTKFNTNPSERVLWTNKSWLKIVPNETKSLSWFQTNMYLLKDLLNLFIGHATYFESVILYGEEEPIDGTDLKPRKEYMYFFKQNKSKLKEKFYWHDVIANFNDISGDLEEILNLWFRKHEMLEVVYNIHFGEFYKDIYIETTFLNTIQVLEIYHRKMYEGKVYAKEEYKELVSDLKEILNEKFPDEFSRIIGGKLNHGNEYSLGMRIEEIINSFQDKSRNILIGNEEEVKLFVRQLVETRNYLTHYDSNNKKNILHDTMKKYYAVQRMRAIATLILFLEVGLDEELMVNKIVSSKQYSNHLRQAKEMLKKS